MRQIIYEAPPLRVYASGPDALYVDASSTPAVRLFAWLALPVVGIGAALVFQREHLTVGWGAFGVCLAVLVPILLYAATYSLTMRIDRTRARRTSKAFGMPMTSRLSYSSSEPPRVEVERTTFKGRDGESTTHYQATLAGRGNTMPLGPSRNSLDKAERDCRPFRRFLGAGEGGVETAERTVSPATQPAWTYPLAHFEASGNCPMCREKLAPPETLVTCEQCRTGYHEACALELGSCATLGCKHRDRGRAST